jgi:hypothetical protein
MVTRFQEPVAPWVSWGLGELSRNVQRVKGPEHEARIVEYFSHTDSGIKDDDAPYCSAALCCGMHECGIGSLRGANARSWLKWGEPSEFRLGAVCVLWRVDPNSWQGHVGIALQSHNGFVKLLGANQKDGGWSVSYYSLDRLLGYRWPKNFDLWDYYGFNK